MKFEIPLLATIIAFISTFGSQHSWLFCTSIFLIFMGFSNLKSKNSKEKYISLISIGLSIVIAYIQKFFILYAIFLTLIPSAVKKEEIKDASLNISMSLILFPKIFSMIGALLLLEGVSLWKYCRNALSDNKLSNDLISRFGIFKIKKISKIFVLLSIIMFLIEIFLLKYMI